jgi:hypothetical protein
MGVSSQAMVNLKVLFQSGLRSKKQASDFQRFILCLRNSRSVPYSRKAMPRNRKNVYAFFSVLQVGVNRSSGGSVAVSSANVDSDDDDDHNDLLVETVL